jgi:hypothetical protein
LVKFVPVKTQRDFVKLFNRIDEKLYMKYGKTRHQIGIHEQRTLLMKSEYQLVVLWDASSKAVAGKFLAIWLKHGRMSVSDGIGTGSNSNVVDERKYN